MYKTFILKFLLQCMNWTWYLANDMQFYVDFVDYVS